MREKTVCAVMALAVLAAIPFPAASQSAETPEDPFLAAIARDFGRSSARLLSLAEAIPAEHFGWRPGDGVRSVGEALLHVAGSNYVLASGLGMPVPDDLTYELAEPGPGLIFGIETEVTDRSEILATLRDSIDRVGQGLLESDGWSLDETVDLVGGISLPRRDLCLVVVGHQNQHLGQTIGYARMVGVVPPWSS